MQSTKLIFIECDRIKYMDQSPKHKKILLYSFDSGDFVNEPKEEQLLVELFSLKKALSQEGKMGTDLFITNENKIGLPQIFA